jgi:hypothetical protein
MLLRMESSQFIRSGQAMLRGSGQQPIEFRKYTCYGIWACIVVASICWSQELEC